MKIGEIIEFEGVRYIAQQEILSCNWCYFDNQAKIDCYKEFGCKTQDDIILVKIPIELLRKIEQLEKQIEQMKSCDNCRNIYFGEKCKKCVNYSKWELKK